MPSFQKSIMYIYNTHTHASAHSHTLLLIALEQKKITNFWQISFLTTARLVLQLLSLSLCLVLFIILTCYFERMKEKIPVNGVK